MTVIEKKEDDAVAVIHNFDLLSYQSLKEIIQFYIIQIFSAYEKATKDCYP